MLPATAELVNFTRTRGSRVVAVGTTVTRALETVTDDAGQVHSGRVDLEMWSLVTADLK